MPFCYFLATIIISLSHSGATWGAPPPELYEQWKKLKFQRRVPLYVERETIPLEVENGIPLPLPGRVHLLNRTTLPMIKSSQDMWFVKLFALSQRLHCYYSIIVQIQIVPFVLFFFMHCTLFFITHCSDRLPYHPSNKHLKHSTIPIGFILGM